MENFISICSSIKYSDNCAFKNDCLLIFEIDTAFTNCD